MIVSDATILITLININEFPLLKLFVDLIIIPHEVYEEVAYKPYAKTYLDNEIRLGFICVESYQNDVLFKEIHYILDDGESASITMAIERKLPLIIDERKGRKFAQSQGIDVVGLVGILRFLYLEKKVNHDKILMIIEKLNNSDFRISSKLLGLILA